jgi:flagellar hook assembly protein FlgD
VARDGHVRLEIYNIRGQRVRTLMNGPVPAGVHEVDWDGTNQRGRPVTSGSYFYRLSVENFTQTRRMIWVR